MADDEKAEESSRADDLDKLDLHICIYKEIPCASHLVLIKRTLTRKGFRNIRFVRIPIRKRLLHSKEKMSTLYYYKNPNTLINQSTHNLPTLAL